MSLLYQNHNKSPEKLPKANSQLKNMYFQIFICVHLKGRVMERDRLKDFFNSLISLANVQNTQGCSRAEPGVQDCLWNLCITGRDLASLAIMYCLPDVSAGNLV